MSSTSINQAICTILAKNYIAAARVLFDSFVEYNPGIDMYVLVTDRIDGYIMPASEGFKVVTITDIGGDELKKILFKYDVLEASTAIKPLLLQYLFHKYNLNKLIYFDPDILFTDNIDDIWKLLDSHSAVLTPHIVGPMPEDERYIQSELNILRCGIYNLGFLALSNNSSVAEFLNWWKIRLDNYCLHDEPPLFVDQKWINLLPGYLSNTFILEDPAYNVAYWNLFNRNIAVSGDKLLVNGKPLKFFHFSGIDLSNLDLISKYQDMYTLNDKPELKPLFNKYRDLVLAHGYAETKNWRYDYDYFDNGIKIAKVIRRLYSTLLKENRTPDFGNPFLTGKGSYFEWLNSSQESKDKIPEITRLWQEIYWSRKDLRASFPDIYGRHRAAYDRWCRTNGKQEYEIDDIFIMNLDESSATIEPTTGNKLRKIILNMVWLPVRWFFSLLGKLFIRNRQTLDHLHQIRQEIDIFFSHK